MTFMQELAKYGVLNKEDRHYLQKKKQNIDVLFGTATKGLMIPFAVSDDGGWTGTGANFAVPNAIYKGIGQTEDETKLGVAVDMTIFNDSETDFLTLRMAKFKATEEEKDYIPVCDPETNFTTNQTLGDDECALELVNRHRNTAKVYGNVTDIPIAPKQLIRIKKGFLPPAFMSSSTAENHWWIWGMRIDFDAPIQLKVKLDTTVYNVNPTN